MPISYLLLGGNLSDREAYLDSAIGHIGLQCGNILEVSGLYETEAWGLTEQAPFLNQALKIETILSATTLLDTVLGIELSLGRVRAEKYGPRTIDIDILFYGDAVLSLPQLTVPHPHLQHRRFALVCLNDIAPQMRHPVCGKTVAQLLAECPDDSTVYKF
jgi:2-amino-4-hydroxy-6-hydroxymethyldihydropteridine diphosphokinase